MKYYISPPPVGPVSRLIATLVAALSLIGFFVFGLVIVGILLAAVMVFASVFWIRAWWLARTIQGKPAPAPRDGQQETVIEAEYTVVHRRCE